MKAIVLGAGHWHAPWHVAALQSHGIEISGVWDHDPDAAASRGAAWGTRSSRDEATLIATGPDLAVLSPRAVDAPELLLRLLEAGIPVIAEKPLGLDATVVERLADLADSSGSFVAVSLVNRLSPIWSIEDRSPTISAAFRIINGTPQRYVDDGVGWVLDPRLGGGGALRNLGFHGADAICSLATGENLTVESATVRLDPRWDVEVYCSATVRSASGWSATVEAGYVNPDREGSDFEWRIARDDSYVVDKDTEMTTSTARGTARLPALPSAGRYKAFISRTLADLATGQAPIAGLRDAARAARLIDDIYAAATTSPATTLEGAP